MTHFLTTLAEITLTMSAVIALLLLLGPLLSRRYVARWRYWAWLAVAVRLLIPFNAALPQAPVQIQAPPDRVVYTYTPPALSPAAAAPGGQTHFSPQTAAPEAEAEAPAPQARQLTLSALLPWLWLAGAAAVLGFHLAGHLRFRRYLRRWAAPVEDPRARALLDGLRAELGVPGPVELLSCPGLGGPMLTGVFRPKVLLPQGHYGEEALYFIFRHELTHRKRRDLAYKALLLLAAAVHWFNPLVWLMLRAAEGDLERACDDGVVAALPPEARARYGQVILSAARSEAAKGGNP